MSSTAAPAIALQDLPVLREKTERVAQALRQHIMAHLETLRPLYIPERVFGRACGGKVDTNLTERGISEVKEKYGAFGGRPFNLAAQFDPNWLQLISTNLELLPWEYSIELGGRAIVMTTPLRWVVNFKGCLPIAKLRAVLAGKETVPPEQLRVHVLSSLALQAILRFNPGLPQLLADLRYDLKVEPLEEFKALPVVTISSFLQTFRPPDDMISVATAFSGIAAFVELVDIEASKNPVDPLKESMLKVLA